MSVVDDDASYGCALALAVLGRGWSDDTGEARADYAHKCKDALHHLIAADDADVTNAAKRMTAGTMAELIGRAIRRLASMQFVAEELALTPPTAH